MAVLGVAYNMFILGPTSLLGSAVFILFYPTMVSICVCGCPRLLIPTPSCFSIWVSVKGHTCVHLCTSKSSFFYQGL